MSLIPPSDISNLHTASEILAVSQSAVEDQTKGAIARCINNAANTGETSVIWPSTLSDDIKTWLQEAGYKVGIANPTGRDYRYVIRWDDAT